MFFNENNPDPFMNGMTIPWHKLAMGAPYDKKPYELKLDSMGEVIDFLDMGIGTYRWPVYNMADIYVTIGIIFLITTGAMLENADKKTRDKDVPANNI